MVNNNDRFNAVDLRLSIINAKINTLIALACLVTIGHAIKYISGGV